MHFTVWFLILLYIVQLQPVVTLTFTRSTPSIPNQSVSRCLLQCYTFLMEHYDSLLSNSHPVNRAALSNHFISLLTLLRVNSFVSLPSILSSSSIEQTLVVERLLFRFIRSQFPKPILLIFISLLILSSQSVIDQFKDHQSLSTVLFLFLFHLVAFYSK